VNVLRAGVFKSGLFDMRAVTVRPLSYRSAFTKYTSPKKTLALISLVLTALSVARVVVCVAESYSAVAQERKQDANLMRLCDSGEGGDAPDFRALCLKKRSERAAPIFLKAMLRAVTSAFTDFCEAFGSTSRILLLVLFCITGVSAPVAKALAAIFIQNLRKRRQRRKEHESDSEDESDDEHNGYTNGYQVIDVGNRLNPRHYYNTRQRLQLSLRRSLRSAAERMGVEPLELGLIKED
tara:strand:- start:93 stop:806 length:714 start_codon:yes stop_codon:yes gene_type:complete